MDSNYSKSIVLLVAFERDPLRVTPLSEKRVWTERRRDEHTDRKHKALAGKERESPLSEGDRKGHGSLIVWVMKFLFSFKLFTFQEHYEIERSLNRIISLWYIRCWGPRYLLALYEVRHRHLARSRETIEKEKQRTRQSLESLKKQKIVDKWQINRNQRVLESF